MATHDRRLTRTTMAFAALLIGGAWACTSNSGTGSTAAPTEVAGGAVGTLAVKPGTGPYQLNLSHIRCTESSQVEIHFVLLNVPSGTAVGNLTWSNSGVQQSPTVPPGPTTGNAIHFNVLVSSGFYDVTSASVTVGGTTVSLHNPDEYAGEYNCNLALCQIFTLPSQYEGAGVCLDRPLGSPSAECGLFGLNPQGGDAGAGAQQIATQSAGLAIVKDGTVGCGGGQQAYRFYANVQAGNLLQQPFYPNGGGISHVTYCGCPQ